MDEGYIPRAKLKPRIKYFRPMEFIQFGTIDVREIRELDDFSPGLLKSKLLENKTEKKKNLLSIYHCLMHQSSALYTPRLIILVAFVYVLIVLSRDFFPFFSKCRSIGGDQSVVVNGIGQGI